MSQAATPDPGSADAAPLAQAHPPDLSTLPRTRYTELRRLPLKLPLGSFAADMLSWGFISNEKWWRNYMHSHSHYEICYAYTGRGTFRMLGVDYPVAGGEVFIAKPGEEHEIIADEEDPLGIYFWSYTLVPDHVPSAETLLDKAARAQHEAIDRLLHAFVESDSWVSRRVPGMLRTLELLTEESIRAEPGYVGVIEGLVRKLLLDTARAAVGEPLDGEALPPAHRDPTETLIAQATRYMRDNLGRIQSVKEIAAQVNFSERHFTRVYRKATGHSPLESLLQMRMNSAKQLLMDRNIPIKEIAARVGYPDVRYFTTVFKKHNGRPPAQFRETRGVKFVDPARDPRKGGVGHIYGGTVRRKDGA